MYGALGAVVTHHLSLNMIVLNCTSRSNRLFPDRILYLAIPDLIYNSFFQLDFPASMLQENSVKLIIYDIELEQILQWKN